MRFVDEFRDADLAQAVGAGDEVLVHADVALANLGPSA